MVTERTSDIVGILVSLNAGPFNFVPMKIFENYPPFVEDFIIVKHIEASL
jgi:hypothetical protein